MKNVYDVLRETRAEVLRLAELVKALELVAPVLDDGAVDPLTAARVGAGVNKAPEHPVKQWP